MSSRSEDDDEPSLTGVRPSHHNTMRAIMPLTYSAVEHELMLCHSGSICVPSTDFAVLTHLRTLEIQTFFDIPYSTLEAAASFLLGYTQESTQIPSVYSLPDVPHQYCDARLSQLDITLWSTVPTTSEFAAGVISLCLRTDHLILGLFGADVFIEDLVADKTDFACSLLANALLYWACVSRVEPEHSGKDSLTTSVHTPRSISGLTGSRMNLEPKLSGYGICSMLHPL